MARSRVVESTEDEHDAVVRHYQALLWADDVRAPWDGTDVEPVTIGPTWQRKGGRWVLPDATIGWDVLGWTGTNLQHSRGKPWRWTGEQARFILWWYSLDEAGRFAYSNGVFQRLKGHGKDPLGAGLCANEMLGPCRFAEWDGGTPISTDNPTAWIQTAAVSLEQTKNTMRLLPGLFSPASKTRYGLQIGKEQVYAEDGTRFFQAVTSSPTTLEGARSTFVLKNETHLWFANNDGHEMAAVIDRNSVKASDGAARTLGITNSFEPGANSTAEQDRDAYEEAAAEGRKMGLLYDTLEAPHDAELSEAAAPAIIGAIRGDSVWLKTERIVEAILDTRNPPSRSRRFWYNQRTASERHWFAAYEFAARAAPDKSVSDGETITLGFDGSRKRARGVTDATALIACRLEDGHVFQPLERSVWEQPEGVAGRDWEVPAFEVEAAVAAIFDRYRVVGFFADPAKWESQVAGWEAKWHKKLKVKATAQHPIQWWFGGGRSLVTARAVDQFYTSVIDGEMTHDGSFVLTRHVGNCYREPTPGGYSIAKEHPDSERKIDAAVAATLAWQARLAAKAAGVDPRKRTGKASFM